MTMTTSMITEQYANLSAKARLVILHPNYPQQRLLLPMLLKNGHYVRLFGSALDQGSIKNQFDDQLTLKALHPSAMVIIDEADRAQSGALADFVIGNLFERLPHGRIIIMGRTLPLEFLQHPNLAEHLCVLPTDRDAMLVDYAAPKERGHRLEVWGLGTGRVMVDGRQINDWDGLLPRALFFYLVDRGMATRAEIFESFWPNLNVREATNVFHVTKRKVSEVLGTDLTEFQSGYYYLAPDIELHYDVLHFNEYVQESADRSPEEAESLLRKAVRLVRGDYIQSMSLSWFVQRRREFRIAHTDALIALGRLVEARSDLHDALHWYMQAFRLMPARSDAAETVMRLMRELGHAPAGDRVYHLHRSALETEEYKRVNEGAASRQR